MMEFKVWGTNTHPSEELDDIEGLHAQLLGYVFLKEVEAENMVEACRSARESSKHDHRYLRVTGGGFAVEFDVRAEFPEAELTAVLGGKR